jgi:RNA recognition motif-containing protein
MPPKKAQGKPKAKPMSIQDFFKKDEAGSRSWADRDDEDELFGDSTQEEAPVTKPAPKSQPAPAPASQPAASVWGKPPSAHPLAKPSANEQKKQAVSMTAKEEEILNSYEMEEGDDEDYDGEDIGLKEPAPQHHQKPTLAKPWLSGKPQSERPAFQEKEIDESAIPKEAPFVLYVGNLPFEATQEDVRGFFGECNTIHCVLPFDREKQKPKGFAYVEFADEENLRKGLEYRGQSLMGRQIRVDVTNPEVAKRYCLASKPQGAFGKFGDKKPRQTFEPKPQRPAPEPTEADLSTTWRRGGKPTPKAPAPVAETEDKTSSPFGGPKRKEGQGLFGSSFKRGEGRGGGRGGRGAGRGGRGEGHEDAAAGGEEPYKPWEDKQSSGTGGFNKKFNDFPGFNKNRPQRGGSNRGGRTTTQESKQDTASNNKFDALTEADNE